MKVTTWQQRGALIKKYDTMRLQGTSLMQVPWHDPGADMRVRAYLSASPPNSGCANGIQ